MNCDPNTLDDETIKEMVGDCLKVPPLATLTMTMLMAKLVKVLPYADAAMFLSCAFKCYENNAPQKLVLITLLYCGKVPGRNRNELFVQLSEEIEHEIAALKSSPTTPKAKA